MADPEEIAEWIKKADEDWRVAEILLTANEELTLPCMFHLQQVIEKLLKAIILKRDIPVTRTHDLMSTGTHRTSSRN
jgi:HEPN domain-containing protein